MKKSIYLVEDDVDISELVCYLLTDIGFDVKAYGTINAFKRNMETSYPDLILLDIMLPDGNGLDICRELKAADQTKPIPAILMSAHLTGRHTLDDSWADDFISKPFDINEFTRKIQLQIAGQS